MSFANFGIISFTNEARVSKFVEYLEEGKIMATRCQECGARFFPPQTECSRCLASRVEWFEIETNGTLLTYTVVRYGPAGFEDRSPYTIVIGEFGDGLRILGHLSQRIPERDIKIGMKLRVAPVKMDGNRITYEFQRADSVRDT
jgi:uncharacterized protein